MDIIDLVDDDQLDVISIEELESIREWMTKCNSSVPKIGIMLNPSGSPYQIPHDCPDIINTKPGGKNKPGQLGKPALKYYDDQGKAHEAEAPRAVYGLETRQINHELKSLAAKYEHHAWEVALDRIRATEGLEEDDVVIVMEMSRHGAHLRDT